MKLCAFSGKISVLQPILTFDDSWLNPIGPHISVAYTLCLHIADIVKGLMGRKIKFWRR